jgi:thioredoxin-related protein
MGHPSKSIASRRSLRLADALMKSFHGKFAITALAAIQLAGFAFAGGEGWVTDFEAAKKQAADEKKDLLVDFTGSDWCGWCIKLNEEVFSHAAFKDGVKDKFVLVEVDFPRDESKLSKATQAQNEELKTRYAVPGFPTVLVCDSQGKPYASTGYQPGGPEKYVASLDQFRKNRIKRDESLAAAAKSEGVEKARHLAAALNFMALPDALVAAFYGDLPNQIKEADPTDETGFTKKEAAKQRLAAHLKEVTQLVIAKDVDAVIALVDKFLQTEELEVETKQQVTMNKANVYIQVGKLDEAAAVADEAIALGPDSRIAKPIATMKQRILKMKETMKENSAE